MAKKDVNERSKQIGEIIPKLVHLDGYSLMLVKTSVDTLAAREQMEKMADAMPEKVIR